VFRCGPGDASRGQPSSTPATNGRVRSSKAWAPRVAAARRLVRMSSLTETATTRRPMSAAAAPTIAAANTDHLSDSNMRRLHGVRRPSEPLGRRCLSYSRPARRAASVAARPATRPENRQPPDGAMAFSRADLGLHPIRATRRYPIVDVTPNGSFRPDVATTRRRALRGTSSPGTGSTGGSSHDPVTMPPSARWASARCPEWRPPPRAGGGSGRLRARSSRSGGWRPGQPRCRHGSTR
jgi:hypothetical protein